MSFLDGGGLNGYGSYEGVDAATEGTIYDNEFSADEREALKLDAYTPRPQGDTRPWWERVAEFGLTRAIDAHYGPTTTNKTSNPATFAGQNGRTYTQGPNGQPVGQGNNLTPLILAGAVALLALG